MKSHILLKSIVEASKELIHSKEFVNNYRIGNSFSRSRKLSFSNTFYFVLHSVKRSLSINYAQLRMDLPELNLPFVSKQAISKSRQGISYEAFKELFDVSVRKYYELNANLKKWNGFHIYSIDGSTIQIPNSNENLEIFGTNPNQYQKDGALASASILYDVMNDIIVDAKLTKYRSNERELAKEHINELTLTKNDSNSIILFDRGYPSNDIFHYLTNNNLLFLMRLSNSFKSLIFPEPDKVIEYRQRNSKESIMLRCIHVQLPNGTMEYLVTNIMKERLARSEFKELYFLRWGIESKYRELKNRLQLEAFSGLKAVSIKQDFYTVMFISNLASMAKSEADKLVCKQTKSNKNQKYQANRSFLINKIKNLFIKMLMMESNMLEALIITIIDEASKTLSIIRPNRRFRRVIKNTRRNQYMHMKPCI